MANSSPILTEALTKSYGRFVALRDCSIRVEQGEVFGLLGPNGAGKSTLLRLLLGFLSPTSGRAWVDGLDCSEQSLAVRHKVAYLPGDPRLFRRQRGREVLAFFAAVRPEVDRQRFTELADRLELDLDRRVAAMSTGMRQKLALVVTLGASTPIVILDEPTSNLDPTVRREVMALVAEARQAGRTVLFSSHVLAEVEQACDRVAILRSGEFVHLQAIGELRRRHRIYLVLQSQNACSPLEVPSALRDHVTVNRKSGREIALETDGNLADLMKWLSTFELQELRIEPIGLQAIYDRFHPAQHGVA